MEVSLIHSTSSINSNTPSDLFPPGANPRIRKIVCKTLDHVPFFLNEIFPQSVHVTYSMGRVTLTGLSQDINSGLLHESLWHCHPPKNGHISRSFKKQLRCIYTFIVTVPTSGCSYYEVRWRKNKSATFLHKEVGLGCGWVKLTALSPHESGVGVLFKK